MDMTKQERLDWLAQIRRIHGEEQRQRLTDSETEIARILRLQEERENGKGRRTDMKEYEHGQLTARERRELPWQQ